MPFMVLGVVIRSVIDVEKFDLLVGENDLSWTLYPIYILGIYPIDQCISITRLSPFRFIYLELRNSPYEICRRITK